jgi:protein-disulfide isomerase
MPEEKSEEKKFDLTPSTAILVAGVLIAGAILFVNAGPAQPVAQGGETVARTSISAPTPADHRRGAADAPIVLVEYSDFQCPYCAMIHPTLARIVEESNGEIAWIYRHLPLESIHPEALPAALASECIAEQLGQSGFWAFADDMFTEKTQMNTARYEALAQTLGADVAAYKTCVESEKYAVKIETQALEAQNNGGTGTPFTVVVRGNTQVPISGALPYAQIMAVINSLR